MSLPVVDLSGPKGRIIDATLALGTERPWRDVALRGIADRAGLSLVEMREHFSSKADVLAAFAHAVDDAVLTAAPQGGGADPKRDQLFEIIMARLDALGPYKTALRSISADASADPALLRAFLSSQVWMLEAAGIAADGIDGGVRVAGLATVYGSVYRTWLEDDDPGLASTMAALDRRLRRGERVLSTIDEVGRTAKDITARIASIFGGRRSGAEKDAGPAAGDQDYGDGGSGNPVAADPPRSV